MATHTPAPRLALRPVFDRRLPDGSWWPENRRLTEQLGHLFALWPPEAGRILRVLYSPPDGDQPAWDNDGGHLWSSHSDGRATIPAGAPMPQTITYRGPPVLVGALAHLLREEGVEFKQPRDDRTEVAEAVVVVLTVTAGDNAPDRTLDAKIDAALAKFKKRFGEDATSVDVADSDDGR